MGVDDCPHALDKVSIQAASAVLLLVALRDSREARSGDLW
jgi:hypothetical protein